jgi:hypothetical protein
MIPEQRCATPIGPIYSIGRDICESLITNELLLIATDVMSSCQAT